LLHAVAVVKVGVFTILKVVLFVFGADLLSQLGLGLVLAYCVCFTTIAASFVALKEDNLKVRLAYSTVSQLSYIILGMALLTTSGITGGVLHIATHAFAKITLFFCAGAIFVASGKTKVSELDGIGKQMPFTMTAFAIGSLSMIGLPPASGFLSKWYLFLGTIEADQALIFIVLAGSAVLNAFYFLPIVYAAFFKELPPGEKAERREAPAFMVVPLMLTAIGTVIILFYPSFFIDLAGMVAASTTGVN
jgi:multicomponent Na+:H+ antiporter subunit D